MSVYVNTEVADDSLISELMQCFLKTDFEDDKFPNISRRMKELKHGEEILEESDGNINELNIQSIMKHINKYLNVGGTYV